MGAAPPAPAPPRSHTIEHTRLAGQRDKMCSLPRIGATRNHLNSLQLRASAHLAPPRTATRPSKSNEPRAVRRAYTGCTLLCTARSLVGPPRPHTCTAPPPPAHATRRDRARAAARSPSCCRARWWRSGRPHGEAPSRGESPIAATAGAPAASSLGSGTASPARRGACTSSSFGASTQ